MLDNRNKKRKYIKPIGILIIFLFLSTPIISALYLNDLEDVNTSTAINCNLLHYNGTMWTNYDLFNQTIIWYKQHIFLDIINAKSYYGDGGNLTNITGASIPIYLTNKAHPHNQDLNTTSNPTFTNITLTTLPNWYYLFIHSAYWDNISNKPNWLTNFAHPHNQNLNTSNNVIFNRVSTDTIISTGSVTTINTDFVIDSNGIYTSRKQPSARARLSSVQAVSGGAYRKLRLATIDYDLNNSFDNLNNRFIVPENGLYQISYSVYCQELADRIVLGSQIYLNGASAGGFVLQSSSTASATDLANSGCDILQLNKNDYIELYVYHNSIGNKNFPAVTYSNYMSICKIS